MSGIFGWIPKNKTDQLHSRVTRMGDSLIHREWHQVDTHTDPDGWFSLGRIGIGIWNKEPQPVISQNGDIILVFSGELKRHNLHLSDIGLNSEVSKLDDPNLILELYKHSGKKTFKLFEGTYQLALLDKSQNILFITNDRYGTYPLYFTNGENGLIFGPEYKSILVHPELQKKINLDALAEYTRFQRLLGDKTFFEGINRLRGATILSYNLTTKELREEKYFDFSELKDPGHSLDEAVENIVHLLTKSMERSLQDDLVPSVYLSGGADSRQVVGLATRFAPTLHTVSYGDPATKDCLVSAKIARKIGSNHHQFPLDDGAWVLKNIDDHLNLTEGFHSWFHMHGITTIQPIRTHIQVQLNGFFGDHLTFSRARDSKYMRDRPKWDRLFFETQAFNNFISVFSWPNVNESEALQIYADPLKSTMRDRAYDCVQTELKTLRHLDNIPMWFAYLLQNHAISLTNYYNVFYRAGIEVRLPYLDYDLFSYINSLPGELRYGRATDLAFGVMDHTIPNINHFPYPKDDLPLTKNKQKLLIGEIKMRGQRAARKLFPKRFKEPAILPIDYEAMLRNNLKDWAEDLLLSERTLDRGLFNPDYLRSIMKRHQNGEIHTLGKFAHLLTYEMVLRKFYD